MREVSFYFLTCWILVALLGKGLVAQTKSDIQELRLTKAQLAIVDGNEKQAMRLIWKNVESGEFHLPTFNYLIEYHETKGDHLKALRVYYYLLRNLHTRKLVDGRFTPNFFSEIKNIPNPTKIVLGLYYKLAGKYYTLSQKQKYSEKLKKRLLFSSLKYFRICEHYNYKIIQTKFDIAKIKNDQEKYDEGLGKLFYARELIENKDKPTKGEVDQANLLIGETLVRDGQNDAGLIYLTNVALDRSAAPSLKQYANAYLEALGAEYLGFSLSHTTRVTDNLHDLDETTLKDFDTNGNQEVFHEANGFVNSRNFSAFYLRRLGKKFGALGIFNLLDERAENRLVKIKDVRNFTFGVNTKYDYLSDYILKLNYSANLLFLRAGNSEPLKKTSLSHTITPQFVTVFRIGTLTIGIPLNVARSFPAKEYTWTRGVQINFSPFFHNRWLTPTIDSTVSDVEEGVGIQDSTQWQLSITNQSTINDYNSIFLTLTHTYTTNDDPTIRSKDRSIDLSYTHTFTFISGLSSTLGVTYKNENTADANKTVVHTGSAGISWSF